MLKSLGCFAAACAFAMTLNLGLVGDASAACRGKMVARAAPGGGTRMVCLDGLYSTCMKDSWSAAAKQRCADKKAQGILR